MCKKFRKRWPHGLGKKFFFPLCSVGKEAAHFLQKNKLLVITFEWNVRFGKKLFSHVLYSFPHLHSNFQKIMTRNKTTITWPKVGKWHICHRGPLGVNVVVIGLVTLNWVNQIPGKKACSKAQVIQFTHEYTSALQVLKKYLNCIVQVEGIWYM
jgi:hypothetical protein